MVPRSEELEHSAADRRALENTAVKKDGGRHDVPKLVLRECSARLAAAHIRSAPGEKACQVFADHGIGCKWETKLLESCSTRLLGVARCQMAFWFFLVLAAFILIWLITGDYNGIVMQQTLVLMGISAATGAFSVAIDSNKSATATTAPIHSNFFDDLLTDVNGITLHRYQMLVWTIALGIIFLFSAYETLATPNFDANLLTLMGISSGTYLGFKLPEKQS